jgi:hypothetical protein
MVNVFINTSSIIIIIVLIVLIINNNNSIKRRNNCASALEQGNGHREISRAGILSSMYHEIHAMVVAQILECGTSLARTGCAIQRSGAIFLAGINVLVDFTFLVWDFSR